MCHCYEFEFLIVICEGYLGMGEALGSAWPQIFWEGSGLTQSLQALTNFSRVSCKVQVQFLYMRHAYKKQSANWQP